MPRRERPLDVGDSALLRFAQDLRSLRDKAGRPTYRELSARAHYSTAVLSQAAAGRRMPSLPVTLAYVEACGGQVAEWRERWRRVVADQEPRPDGERPYVGLNAFQPTDANRFFGRARMVREVLARLADQRVVLLFGASGAGKSSLLRAGVVARLDGPVLLFTPGEHPLEECAIHLGRLGGTPAPSLGGTRFALAEHLRQAVPDGTEPVVVVDQFEEVFTLCRDPAEREAFVDALLTAASEEHGRCRVVLGVRADFYAHCTTSAPLVEAMAAGQITLGPMTTDELRQAVLQPAVRAGYAVETALLTELVAHARGQHGVLPLLSHALLETWLRRKGNTLTLAGFQAAGGIDGALAQTAEALFAGLTARQQVVARDLVLRLIAPGDGTEDTKRRITWAELDDDPDVRAVLDLLGGARLVTLDRHNVELSHEALVRAWPRLRDWLAEEREGLRLHRELTRATDAWEALDGDSSALYRGTRLVLARQWASRNPTALTARERRLLDASLAADAAETEQARKRAHQQKHAVVLLGVLFLLAVTATAYAVSAQQSARWQRDRALSEIVAAKAVNLRPEDPALAAQLSLAAYRLAPTGEARASLLATFPYPYRRLTGHSANLDSVAVGSDGLLLVTAGHDRVARLWDLTDRGRPVRAGTLVGHEDTVNGVAVQPGGRVVATASWDRTARLWDATDPSAPVLLSTLGTHTDDVNAVAFSPDGRTVATTSTDRTAKLWDVTNPRNPRETTTLAGHGNGVVAVAFSPDGRTLATASFDNTVVLWDLTGSGARTVLAGHQAPVTAVAFSPDGTRVVSAGQDRVARLWETATGHELAVLRGHDGIVRAAVFSPDGRTVATGSEDITVQLWSTAGGGRVAELGAHAEAVVSLAFTSDGRTLVSGSDDDTAVLWRIPDVPLEQVDVDDAAGWVCRAVDGPVTREQWDAYFPGLPYRPPC
ncbi:hypothetical protein ACFFQW_31405 [Umezawaea endophytica]|uniref:HTH cro/C1-type domain-containing protein n=1 Tax=Umezawaea endophytica TaxID=1654476 RepID=A0A9X2VER9_9PSEU|nr:hypothetical protein [Umezawaea endophytica]MCS7475345.1 hypothetical protein [Umezawaea endophytica]